MTDRPRERLGDLLVRANLIDEIQLRVALTAQQDTRERLGTTLIELGFIEEAVLAAFLAKQADLPCINIESLHIPREVLNLVPAQLALERRVVPIRRSGSVVYLAMADPFDTESLAAVQAVLPPPLEVLPMIAPELSLREALQRAYAPEEGELGDAAPHTGRDPFLTGQLEVVNQKLDLLTAKIDALTAIMSELLTPPPDEGGTPHA